MDHARAIGLGLPRPEAVLGTRDELGMMVGGRIDPAPLGHFGDVPGIAEHRPGGAMAVRLAGLAALLHVGQDVYVDIGVLV